MSAKRAFGSIRQLPSGRFQVRYRTLDGKQHTGPTTFPTKKGAEAFLSATETDLARGAWVDPDLSDTPFEDLVLNWRASHPTKRDGSVGSDVSYLRTMILPFFGDLTAGDITIDVVREWHAWAKDLPRYPDRKPTAKTTAKPRAHSTTAKGYRLLAAIMGQAVEDGIIPRTPCRLKGVASDRTPEQRTATPAEVERIASKIDGRYKAMVLVAAYGGLRLGELIGLRRHRIDWTANSIRVIEQVTQTGGRFTVGPPKTDAGVRTVAMPPEVMEVLRSHVDAYAEPGHKGLVFTAPKGGYLRRSNFGRRHWHPAREAAGVDYLRFHDLRHTHATLAIANGADTRTLQARMGHATARAALIYQHAQPDQGIANLFSAVYTQAKAEAAKAAGTDDEGAVSDDSTPPDASSCGTPVARNGLYVVS